MMCAGNAGMTMVRRVSARKTLSSLLRGRAPLRFLFSRLFPWLGFRRQFAAPLRGPSGLVHLPAARDSQTICWYVVGDRGTRGDIRAVADSNRRNQSGIAPDK